MSTHTFASILEDVRTGLIDRPEAAIRLQALRSGTPAAAQIPDAQTAGGRHEPPRPGGIAVIGMAGQFPGARDIHEFWHVLLGNTPVPADRRLPGRDGFDPLFFRIAPREADDMSLHQRLVLQESWKALEDAAIAPATLAGSATSIYIGAEPVGWAGASLTGSSDAIIASRLAYFLDLRGAALVVNTGCSSSGIAIHLACEALRHGETDMALAGGVFANLAPEIARELRRIGMVSPSGRCLTFDAGADGTVLCEGVGIVVLKRLADAVAAGDPIRGVIVASGTNQDGASNGITAPNGLAQEELFRTIYRRFGIAPETISYIEAHGTGTALGDPVEANALIRAFRHFTDRQRFCQLGSAKATIGHASAAAGVIGLIKILLSMEHGTLPGLAQFTRLNPLIDLDRTAFTIETETRAWKAQPGQPLTAALSAFGHSGTNAHFVVQQLDLAPAADAVPDEAPEAIPLSARTPAGLTAAMGRLRDFLLSADPSPAPDLTGHIRSSLAAILRVDEESIDLDEPLDDLGVGPDHRLRLRQDVQARTGVDLPTWQGATLRDIAAASQSGGSSDLRLADVAYTLQHGRDHRETRAVFIASSVGDLLAQLDARLAGSDIGSVVPQAAPSELTKLAERWLKGGEGVWKLPVRRARRLHLPVCAFVGAGGNGPAPAAPAPAPEATLSYVPAPLALSPVGPVMFTPVWDPVSVVPAVLDDAALRRLVVIADPGDSRAGTLRLAYPGLTCVTGADDARLRGIAAGDHLCWLAPPSRNPGSPHDPVVLRLLTLVRGLLSRGAAETALEWTIITTGAQSTHTAEPVDPHHAAVHGLAGSVAKECLAWRFRMADLPFGGDVLTPANFVGVLGIPLDRRGVPWVARSVDEGVRLQWRRQKLVPLRVNGEPPAAYRESAVYVVIGGAGDIGRIWTEHVIRSARARVVWVGRRPEDETIRGNIRCLAELGPSPVYLSADATDGAALAGVRDEVKRRFGRIDGVVHSALDFFETPIADMDTPLFLRGFLAKAESSTQLARVFAGEPLDFVLTFSSVAAQIKNPRQGAYVAGCAFSDAVAHELNRLWPCPVKTINWGYWSSTRQQVADASAYQAFLRLADVGLGLIEPEEGMRALNWLLASPLRQVGIVKTTRPIEIEGLDASQVLHVEAGIAAPSVPEAGTMPIGDIADLQSSSEIHGLDAVLLPLLATQLRAAGALDAGWRPTGTYLDKWVTESLALLERHGSAAEGWAAWRDLRATWQGDAARDAQLDLAETALKAMPDILTGRRQATDVLFPGGSVGLVENVHRHNPVADYFQHSLAALVVAALRSHRNGALRILEVGAGTGATTARVLEALNEACNRDAAACLGVYTYTDISTALLQHGEAAFGRDRPYLKFRRLDIEQPPLGQAFGDDIYDVVIAANVLHATRDIRRTVRHVKSLLKPGGLLLACEVSRNALFTHLTFGLLEGWWLPEDAELRIPGSPGLTPEAWRRTLHEEGFPRVDFPLAHAHGLGQQIILAASDGIVRASATAPAAVVAKPDEPPERMPGPCRRDSAIALFQEIIGATLKIPAAEVIPTAPLDRYGMDSILAVKLAEELNRDFTDVSSALVFEHQTVADIADHFIRTRGDVVARLLARRMPAVTPEPEAQVPPLPLAAPPLTRGPVAEAADDRIAVVGMSGRFPGADTVDELWALLRDGRCAITNMPAERWDQHQMDLFQGDAAQFNTRGGYAGDIRMFDPMFFGISPMEARFIDPRQRLFLQEAWHAFEDAGIMADTLRGSNCAVYVGVEEGEYGFLTNGRGQISSNQIATLAARIAYILDLHGPNFALSAACSSGLVAIHQASQSLRSGECDLALAGGVSLIVSPVVHLGLAHAKMLSATGECRVFDADASGMVPADGVAAVVLKRLADAVRDNDRIHGCIRASGVNYDGKTMGLATPNPRSQARLIESVHQRAGILPDSIQFILAHSVGSALTDPVEVQALSDAFAQRGAEAGPCTLASIKPLIGHSFAASGVVSLIAMLLALRHKTMPATHGFAGAHPRVRLGAGPFAIGSENQAWLRPPGGLRRGAIGTTGLSGTNAHAVIEEFIPAEAGPSPPDAPQIFVFSARTEDRLAAVVGQFLDTLGRLDGVPLRDMAYTLQAGRDGQSHRLAFVARDRTELRATAEAALRGEAAGGTVHRGDTGQPANPLAGFLSGHAGEAFTTALARDRELDKLAALWVQGCQVPWRLLHGDPAPRRIGLPGYPFAREPYWVTDTAVGAEPTASRLLPEQPAPSGSGILADTIRQFFAASLDMPAGEIPDRTHWRDYGVDSIIETRLMLMLEETAGFSISGRELADYPTIAGLSEHLAARSTATPDRDDPADVGMPMSDGQKGLWMLHLLQPGSAAYNIPIAFRIRGAWNRAAFLDAVAAVYQSFPILRSAVTEADGEATLHTLPSSTLDLRVEPCPDPADTDLIAFLRAAAQEPFALTTGPLMRTRVWTSEATGHDIVLITIHHLIFDGTSAVTFLKALWNAYDDVCRGKPVTPPITAGSFADFVVRERDMLAGPKGEVLRDYWRRQLSGVSASLSLASDRAALPEQPPAAGRTHRVTLDPDLSARLRNLGREHGIRDSVVFLALYQALVARLARNTDPLIGLTAMVRPHARFQDTIGYFVNTLPIRQPIDRDAPFVEHARRLQDSVVDGLDHAAYPFPVLVRELWSADGRGASPVIQTAFSFQNFVPKPLKDVRNSYARVLPIEAIPEVTQEGDFNLALDVEEDSEGFRLLFKYTLDLWAPSTIESLAASFVQMARELVDGPERPWGDIRPGKPRAAWVRGPEMPDDGLDIIDAIEAAVRRAPDAAAVVVADDDPEEISYRDLNERANRIACRLAASGLDLARPAGVCIRRSIDSVAVLLALLKIGAPYLPLDPHDSRDRLAGVIRDAAPGCLLTDGGTAALFSPSESGPRTLAIEALLSDRASSPGQDLARPVDPSAPAYIIFTSGSTGAPKGVVIERQSLSAHCRSMRRWLGCEPADRVLQFTPLHLDPSLEQILVALSAGAAAVLRGAGLWTAAIFWDQVRRHRISVIDVTPSYLREILPGAPDPAPPSLRRVIAGGEAFSLDLYHRWQDSPLAKISLVNAYGPTETTITSAVFEAGPGASVPAAGRTVPIGRPLPGEEILILDEQGEPVAEGFPGEIHIGGSGVARGYLHRTDLTAERFIEPPSGARALAISRRFFRTGDLGRYCPGTGGLIECLGRIDRQVKIRGVRVELDEVVAAIREFPRVTAAEVALETAAHGDPQLAAAVTFAPGENAENGFRQLRHFLETRLPATMIPGRLHDPGAPAPAQQAPANKAGGGDIVEMAALWQDLLHRPRIEPDDGFFELGGHSLLAIRLLYQIEKRFGIRLGLSAFLQHPTVAGVCRLLLEGQPAELPPVPSAQQGTVFFLHPGDGAFVAEQRFADGLESVPFQALRWPDDREQDYPACVEDLAEHHVRDILRLQPDGACHLCGWSFGGLVAFEVAHRLRRLGRTVGLLVLIDAYTPQYLQRVQAAENVAVPEVSPLVEFGQRLFMASGVSPGAGTIARLADSRHGLAALTVVARDCGIATTDAETALIQRSFHIFERNALAMRAYVPPAYDGNVVLIRAREERARGGDDMDDYAGWRAYCGGAIELLVLEGDHYSLLLPPFVEQVVRVLANRLAPGR